MALKISIHNSEWSDEIDLPIDETKQDRILNLLDSVEDSQFKIAQCDEIPELNGASFAENAHFSELIRTEHKLKSAIRRKKQALGLKESQSEQKF